MGGGREGEKNIRKKRKEKERKKERNLQYLLYLIQILWPDSLASWWLGEAPKPLALFRVLRASSHYIRLNVPLI